MCLKILSWLRGKGNFVYLHFILLFTKCLECQEKTGEEEAGSTKCVCAPPSVTLPHFVRPAVREGFCSGRYGGLDSYTELLRKEEVKMPKTANIFTDPAFPSLLFTKIH